MGGCVGDTDDKPGPVTSVLWRCGGVICGPGSLSDDEPEGESEEEEYDDGACRVGVCSPSGSS